MGFSPINLFDAAIYLALFAAVVMGFMSGLLRSLATIFGYLAAAPIAVTVTPMVSRLFTFAALVQIAFGCHLKLLLVIRDMGW